MSGTLYCSLCGVDKEICQCQPSPEKEPSVIDFDDSVAERLKNKEFALAYLKEVSTLQSQLLKAEAALKASEERAATLQTSLDSSLAQLREAEKLHYDAVRFVTEIKVECSKVTGNKHNPKIIEGCIFFIETAVGIFFNNKRHREALTKKEKQE